MSHSAAIFRASNLQVMDYPFDAALASALALCDEAVIVLGRCVDDTRDWVYALRSFYGAGRVTVVEREWQFDRGWQERVWGWAATATDAEWLMFIDADEVLHEQDIPRVKALMRDDGIHLINFPFRHFYATKDWHVISGFLTRNTRLGRRSVGWRMRNWCSDAHPKRSACQMVFQPNGREVNAHAWRGDGIALVDVPIYHYGWARNGRALAVSQAKHRAWYNDDDRLYDGHIPDVKRWDFDLDGMLREGRIARYKGPHPAVMAGWFERHADPWQEIAHEHLGVHHR